MQFFNNFTLQKGVGLILLIVSAIITYRSEKIAFAIKKPQFNIGIKVIGLIVVVIAFVLIMTAI